MLPHAVASANGPITGLHPMAIIHVFWDRRSVLTFQLTFTMLIQELSDAPVRSQDNRHDSGCASRQGRCGGPSHCGVYSSMSFSIAAFCFCTLLLLRGFCLAEVPANSGMAAKQTTLASTLLTLWYGSPAKTWPCLKVTRRFFDGGRFL